MVLIIIIGPIEDIYGHRYINKLLWKERIIRVQHGRQRNCHPRQGYFRDMGRELSRIYHCSRRQLCWRVELVEWERVRNLVWWTPPCKFNGEKRNMHQRHLTGGTTELIPRASLVGPTGVSKCVSYSDIFRALSGHLSRVSLWQGNVQMLVVAISFP